MHNAHILERTMNNYSGLKKKLNSGGFESVPDGKNTRVNVPFDKISEFADIVRAHLNAPCNYVDVQFPKEKKTAVIFIEKTTIITNIKENEAVKKWAIAKGLPPREADWKTSF